MGGQRLDAKERRNEEGKERRVRMQGTSRKYRRDSVKGKQSEAGE